jgi:hypothetical protein
MSSASARLVGVELYFDDLVASRADQTALDDGPLRKTAVL